MDEHNLTRINVLLREAEAVSADRVSCFGAIDSTNSWLMRHADRHGRVCLAELQTAGRGRRGRQWHAPRSSSVLLSIGWRLGGAERSGLSLVSGLAIVDALRRAGVDSVGLKWPNDVMVAGKKLGGVLTELSGDHCVIGMGINVAMPPMRSPDDDPIHTDIGRTDLKSLGHNMNRDALAAALIISHCRYLRRFCGDHGAGRFAQFVEEWNALNIHRGVAVSVTSKAASFEGIVRGVGSDGALLIEQDGVRRRLISGEASVRPVAAHNTR